jgi:hypothetical protein
MTLRSNAILVPASNPVRPRARAILAMPVLLALAVAVGCTKDKGDGPLPEAEAAQLAKESTDFGNRAGDRYVELYQAGVGRAFVALSQTVSALDRPIVIQRVLDEISSEPCARMIRDITLNVKLIQEAKKDPKRTVYHFVVVPDSLPSTAAQRDRFIATKAKRDALLGHLEAARLPAGALALSLASWQKLMTAHLQSQ